VREGTGSLAVSGGGLELTPFQLRRAFEEAAHYPGIGDDHPVGRVRRRRHTRRRPGAVPADRLGRLLPRAGVRRGRRGAGQLGVRGTPREPKSGDACAFNTAQHELRHAYWDNVAIGSESFLTTDDDPFVHC
jgi:hypothetical protein